MLKNSLLGKVIAVVGLVSAAAGLAIASSHVGAGITPDEALQNLMDGNKRYIENKMTGSKLCDATTRAGLAKSQKPHYDLDDGLVTIFK